MRVRLSDTRSRMLLVQIAARVDRSLKARLRDEVKRRRSLGHGDDLSDLMRDALIEYLDRLDSCHGGRQRRRNDKVAA